MISKQTTSMFFLFVSISFILLYKLMMGAYNFNQEKKFVDIQYMYLSKDYKKHISLKAPKGKINISAIFVENKQSSVEQYELDNIPQMRIQISLNSLEKHDNLKKEYVDAFKKFETNIYSKDKNIKFEETLNQFTNELNEIFTKYN